MSNIPDSKQRNMALDPRQSFIVRAPAGSGKTELLIRRYLKLLSGVEYPEEIIAITFTRKAAKEMRDRIISALELARTGGIPTDDYQKETHVLATEITKRDKDKKWQLQDNPMRLRIQTLDSLWSDITRKMPVLSQLGAQPETLDDASQFYLQAAERTLLALEDGGNKNATSWSDAVAKLLAHLDNDLPKLKELLANMLERRNQWLRYIADDNISREKLDEAFTYNFSAILRRAREAITNSEELIECIKYAAKNLQDEGKESLIIQCAGLDALPEANPDALAQWRGIVELLLTRENSWRKTVNKNNGFPAGEKIFKPLFKQLLEQYSGNENLLEKLIGIRYIPEIWNLKENGKTAWLDDDQWKILQALPSLLVFAEAQLRVLFSEHSKIDFIGIEQSALLALRDNEKPTDLALQLDYRIQHILVDEFQDVSVTQYDLLEKLTEGWCENDGRTLFLVGDPMQSIYCFRAAEVGKFLSVFNKKKLGQLQLQPLTLTINFRSQQGVVTWINDAFETIFPQQQDITKSAVNYSPVFAVDKSGAGQVVIHPLFQDNSHEEEAKQIVHTVKRIEKEATVKDIAILVRARSQLDAIIAHFRQAKICFQAVDIELLSHRTAVQDCLALTRALLHPSDRIAWLAILRAPWCGLTLADLNTLASDKKTSIWSCMNDELRIKKMSNDGQKRLSKLREILEKAMTNRQRRSLRRMVEMVWMKIGGPATLEDDSDLENVQTYFDALQKEEKSGDLKTLAKLEKIVEELYAATDTQSLDELDGSNKLNIQIMTIHKAKGLEFDVVILPGLNYRIPSMDKRLLLWQEQQREDNTNDLLLAPIKEIGINTDNTLCSYLEMLEKTKLENERDRLLYVAATRAKKQLHLFGSVRLKKKNKPFLSKENPLLAAIWPIKYKLPSPGKNSLLATLWPMVKEDYQKEYCLAYPSGHLEDIIKETTLPVEVKNYFYRQISAWEIPEPPENINWQKNEATVAETSDSDIKFEWAEETIRHVGIVVHRCIQLICEDQTNNRYIWDKKRIQEKRAWFRQALVWRGVGVEEINLASKQVEEALINMIQDKRGQWLFSAEHKQQKNEYALSGIYQDKVISIKIDRTFVDKDGTRWIIDYKTSRHEGKDVDIFLDQQQERYKEQLEKYGVLMKGYGEQSIKLGLYFPLLQGWRAWEY